MAKETNVQLKHKSNQTDLQSVHWVSWSWLLEFGEEVQHGNLRFILDGKHRQGMRKCTDIGKGKPRKLRLESFEITSRRLKARRIKLSAKK